MIYLDSAASTRPSDGAARLFGDSLIKYYANPDSTHAAGMETYKQTELARAAVAGVLRVCPEEIVFTSSGTEANNLAVFGACRKNKTRNKIIISDLEHPSVYMPVRELEKQGFEIVYLPAKNGVTDVDFLKKNLDDRVALVSVMLVNNETGVIFDLKSIAGIIGETYKNKEYRPYLHCDGVQAFGKLNINLNILKLDMFSASAHKIHGVKGAGFLYLRKGVKITPQIFGGGQEKGLRSSTLNTPAIIAFGKAAEELDIQKNAGIIDKLYDYTVEKIKEKCPDVVFNQKNADISKYILSLRLPNVKSEIMLNYLSSLNIYISSGSACSAKNSSALESMRVLLNYGLDKNSADFTVRVSFSKYNTREEIDVFTDALAEGIKKYAVY